MSNGTSELDKRHCIHLENGRFSPKTDTQAGDVATLVESFAASNSPSGMVIHFHGGLVSYAAGKGIAQRLTPEYSQAGAYPVFFVWEAGAWETIVNNLSDIAKEDIFRELLRKAIQFALRRLGGAVGVKGGGPAAVDPYEVTRAVDAWFAGSMDAVPYAEHSLVPGADATRAAAPIDAMFGLEIQADLEQDQRFSKAVEAVTNGLLPSGQVEAVRGGGSRASTATLMDPEALAEMVEAPGPGQKGLIQMAKVAAKVAKVVFRVVKRFVKGRDHGLYATVEEEILREFYVGKIGKALLWNQMKKDTADAFSAESKPGYEPGGTLFLEKLGAYLEVRNSSGESTPRITLIGHSTGAVYICNFLAAADRWLPADAVFDIILLAPACDFPCFREAMEQHAGRVGCVRMFGMEDKVELADPMAQDMLGRPIARLVYPHSLLYFVSGLLEDESEDKPDHPILGMQRFFDRTDVYDPSDFPDVGWARSDLLANQTRHKIIWSVTADDAPEGQRSTSRKHGDFDNDTSTIESIQWLLRNGFQS